MRKFIVTIFIFLLIFSIAFIKNSSKKIEDEIFFVKENLRGLKKELNNTKLEFEYLSSTEKLLEYQSQFFEKNLVQKNINKIKTLTKKSDSLFITNLDLVTDNIINEDSKALSFNYQNQYSDSRFYGTDLDDSSTRIIYGFENNFNVLDHKLDFNFNQSYDFEKETNYTNQINQKSNFSDIFTYSIG